MTEVGGAVHLQDSPLVSLIYSAASTSSLTRPKDLDDPSPASHSYLLSLTSHSLLDLRSQPAALLTAKTSLNTQLSSLCSQHVSSFVQVHRATSSLPTSLSTLDSALQSLIERDLPALSNVAQQFSHEVEAPLLAKEKAHNLISQYDFSLKDLLDIPKLLMTCVRASHPVEALQLAAHMMKIASQSKQSSVHRALQEECWIHLKRLREDLLRGLGARGLRLPAAKRLVSLLRKFKEVDEANGAREGETELASVERLSLSDSTICLSLLRSRWTLIEEIASNASVPKSSSGLSLHLSTWRDIVGDTCGMTQSLFRGGAQDDQDELSPSTLVSLFSNQALAVLRRLLSEAIPGLREEAFSLQDNFDTLAGIHTQLAYTAASLVRQGLDISNLVSGREVFHMEVVTLWKKALKECKAGFDKCRRGKNATDYLSWVESRNMQGILDQDLQSYSSSEAWSGRAKQFPDLLILVNGLLECYNALLSFAPTTTGKELVAAVDEILLETLKPLFSAIQTNERVEFNLALPPIVSSNPKSRYFENDSARQSEANLAILARMLTVLCGPAVDHVQDLIRDLFGLKEEQSSQLSDVRTNVFQWARVAEETWKEGERVRTERVRVEEETIAAEERRRREEEEARQAELEKRRAEEAVRRQEEETERQRLLEIKQREEAKAEQKRAAEAAEESRRREEEDRKARQREAEEEAKRKEEEQIRQQKLQEEILKKEKAEEEARLQRAAEEEREREAAEQVEQEKQKEEEARQKTEETAAEKRKNADVVGEGEKMEQEPSESLVAEGGEVDETKEDGTMEMDGEKEDVEEEKIEEAVSSAS